MKLSARNQLKGRVTEINEGAVEAVVKIDVSGQHITSVVTLEAVRELGLSVGSEAIAIIKADHVMLGVE